LANQIKNKYTAPKSTEFTPKDLVVDVKNGRLYYKSNYAVYEIRGTIFSATTNIDESTQLGDSQNTEIIFNNNGAYDGISDFTISDIQGDGTGTVNIGTATITDATITTADINGGTIDGITSLTAGGNLDIGAYGFRASSLTADGLTSGRVVFAGTNGLLSDDSGFEYNEPNNELSSGRLKLSSTALSPGSATKISLGTEVGSVSYNLRIRSNSGYVSIGPKNTSYSHFQTDRSRFYHNKSIVVNSSVSTDGGYTLTTYQNKDFTITTSEKGFDGPSGGGRIKLAHSTTSNAANGVEIKGNLKVLPDGSNSQVGIIRSSGDIIAFASSDKRLKDNIIPISNPIEKLLQIGGYTFEWNKKQDTYNGQDVGVIAQEIEKVLPEIVEERENGYKAVKYEKIVPLLIEAIKDQQKQIDNLKNKLDGLA